MIVVTGATGFIGSNLLAELENRGYNDIVAIDSFGTGDKWKNVAKRSSVRFIFPEQAELFLNTNRDIISSIIHLGAISSTTERDVDLIAKTNIQLTMWLYDLCKENQISFIYASSAATYGQGKNERDFIDDESLACLSNLKPLNPYGWSKLCVDKLIVADKLKNDVQNQVVGLRFFNVYGPNEYHKGGQMSVVASFFEQYQTDGVAKLFKSNGARRDFVYVDDCVDVIVWMIKHPKCNGLFNVGTGEAVSYEQVAHCVSEAMGLDGAIEYIDMPKEIANQYQFYTQAQMDKLNAAGYVRRMTSVSEGISKYVNTYLKNENQKYK